MASVAVWARAIRIPFFTATIIPVLLGSAIAWNLTHAFDWMLFFLLLIAALCVHAALNLFNDYFDHLSGNDAANEKPTPFSGGSRVIQQKKISPLKVRNLASFFLLAGIVLGLYLNYILPGNAFLIIGALGLFLALFNSAPPLKLGYRGFGEIAVGFGFGILIVVSAFFTQTGMITKESVIASLPIAVLILLVLLINEFPDYAADKKTKKKTWVVLLGKQKAFWLYTLLLVSAYGAAVYGVIVGALPVLALGVFVTLPLAIKAFMVGKKHYKRIDELLPANKFTIMLHFFFGLVMIVAYLIDGIL